LLNRLAFLPVQASVERLADACRTAIRRPSERLSAAGL